MTMREKMARAMAQADGVPVALSEMPTAALSRYVAMADAALSAMEEPTEAMLRDGDMAACSFKGIAGIWRAMLAAAKAT